MKAIILGGGGIMGLSLLVYLKERKEFSNILVTDIQEDIIKQRVSWLNDKRFSIKTVDASDFNALVSAIQGYDIVLNTSRPKDKTIAIRAAAEANANYIDSGVEQIDEKLAFNNDFN